MVLVLIDQDVRCVYHFLSTAVVAAAQCIVGRGALPFAPAAPAEVVCVFLGGCADGAVDTQVCLISSFHVGQAAWTLQKRALDYY